MLVRTFFSLEMMYTLRLIKYNGKRYLKYLLPYFISTYYFCGNKKHVFLKY